MTEQQFIKNIIPLNERLSRYAWYYLKNKDDVYDVIQEVYIKLWKMKDTLEKYQSSLALALRITRNQCLDVVRKRSKSHELLIGESIVEPEVVYDNSQEVYENIKKAVNKLSGIQKEIMILKDIEGYDYDEISGILDMDINAIRVNVSRARKKVREMLKDLKCCR
ncbi:MAG: RNA polymerase sigma factor [Bacteroidales bacterium]|jgi:RNA polymerase sigma-70 factor (ECF subfamily)|nr:RNA polymerase sigma factor [Bacteroidales bacterium]